MAPVDVLYLICSNPNDSGSLERLRLSVESILIGTYQDVRICLADLSEVSLYKALCKTLPVPFAYCHRHRSGPYNRSYNINVGVRNLIRSRMFFISDIDIIYPRDHIQKHIDLEGKYPLVFSHVVRLEKGLWSSDYEKLKQHKKGPEVPIGGICFCRRMTFINLNGYDELYEGWGGEDDDFRVRMSYFGDVITPKERKVSTVFHLWHEPYIKDQSVQFGFRDKNAATFFQRERLYKEGKLDPSKVNPNGWGLDG